jgi:ubiquilin
LDGAAEKAMGGEPEGAAAAVKGGSRAVLYMRWSNGNKFVVEVDLGATVLALKGLLVERAEIPTD